MKSEMDGEDMLKDRKKKKSIMIMVMLAGVLLAGIIVYAAYVSQGHQKAVVATAKKSVPFSSNYLKLMDNSDTPTLETVNPILAAQNDETSTFEVTVNNFSLTNASQSANNYITYTVTFTFEGKTEDCTVNEENPENGSISFTRTLKLGRNTDTYSFKIPNAAIGSLKIKAVVVPDDSSKNTVGNKMLAAVLVPQKSAGKVTFRCTGEFVDAATDETDENKPQPSDYSAFRYRIEITTGVADITLSWKSDCVELDPVFIESLKLDSSITESNENGYKSISFVMDYSQMSTYNMVFYRTKRRNANEGWQTTWKNLENAGIVKVKATERSTDSSQR